MDREPQPRDLVIMPDAIAGSPEAVVSVSDGRVTLRGLFSRTPVRTVSLPPPWMIQHAGYLSPRLA